MKRLELFKHVTRSLSYLACLGLTGCIFGYYAPAPEGYRGDFVLNADGATLYSCEAGVRFWTLWDTSNPVTCIYPGQYDCSSCTLLPAGTPVKVLHEYVLEGEDVSLRVGSGATSKVVHTHHWQEFKKILERLDLSKARSAQMRDSSFR